MDRKRTPGRFLLTGSANVLLLPQVAESLAGRMEIVNLWPFSQGEIEGAGEEFIAAAFGDAPPALSRRPSSDPLTDTGLAAHLMGIDDARLADDRGLFKYPGTLGHIRVIWFEGDPSSIRSRRFPA